MITVVPIPLGVTTLPATLATPGSDEVKVHAPGEFEVGTFRLNEVTLSLDIDRSENAPTVGLMAVICSVFVVLALV